VRHACVVLALVACGGGGGTARPNVDGNKRLADLTPSELDALCSWEEATTGGARTVDCGGGLTVTFKSKAQCAAALPPASCQATVGQTEDCIDALDANPCSFGGSACEPLLACGM
jgi:hypothetical protein